jgi:hypothetical protein
MGDTIKPAVRSVEKVASIFSAGARVICYSWFKRHVDNGEKIN